MGTCILEAHLIVANKVLIPLSSFELYSKSSEIPHCVGRAALGSDCGYPRQNLSPLPDAIEEVGICQIGDVVGDFVISQCSSCFGMDCSFRNTFSGEVSQVLDELCTGQENETTS
jgi:hypothetical protein